MKSNETISKDTGRPLYAALVDTVSSKVLYRILLSNTAAAPVHTLLVENHLIVTYWNAKAKRTELSSSALYEGMVDVFGLSPLSYFSALPQQIRDANLSSFSSPLPLGIQRTYIIPRTVTSLHHTITSRGKYFPLFIYCLFWFISLYFTLFYFILFYFSSYFSPYEVSLFFVSTILKYLRMHLS